MVKMIMTIGIPGSGKSTFIKDSSRSKEYLGYKIHGSDDLREELYSDVNNQTNNVKLFEILHKRIKADLIQGNNVIYNATNLSYKRRKGFLESLNKIECEKVAIVMATPFNDCINRDRNRGKSVGKQVLDRMYKSFTMPSKMEGFDKILLEYSDYSKGNYDIYKKMLTLRDMPQFNKYHSKTIGGHCLAVASNVKVERPNIEMAGLLHDIGKQYTMSFRNSKGEYTDQAHFYGHENVSAYESMFYLKEEGFYDEDIIYICNLIQYHMKPHLLETTKGINKLKRFLGEEFYKDLMILHEADKMAK